MRLSTRPQNFIMGNEETELGLSVESRSFVNWVNFQVRRRRRTFNYLGNVESAVFMGKNFQDNQNSIVNSADVTLKQMFKTSAKLVAEQDEISGLERLVGKNIHGNICHTLMMKVSSIFNTSRREEACLQNLCYVVDLSSHRCLGAQVGSAQRTLHPFLSSSTLAWQRSRYSWNWDVDLFLIFQELRW